MNTVDTLVYLPAPLGSRETSEITAKLGALSGVHLAQVNKHIKQLVDIEFDPELISGKGILEFVRGNGYKSYLIGM